MKIIVSDFDGTLFSEEYENNLEAINRFVDAGNMFIIATGRAMNYLAEDLSMVDLNCEYYICNDGAVIFDRYFNVIYRKDIKQEIVRPIYNILADDENIIETFIDTSHGYVTNPSKCANGIIARPYDRGEAALILDKILRKYPDVHGYMSNNWINLTDISVNKAVAIEYLIDTYNYNVDDVVTVGDGLNDYEMIERFRGYTFDHGAEDLKSISVGVIHNLKEIVEILKLEEEDNDEEEEDYI